MHKEAVSFLFLKHLQQVQFLSVVARMYIIYIYIYTRKNIYKCTDRYKHLNVQIYIYIYIQK